MYNILDILEDFRGTEGNYFGFYSRSSGKTTACMEYALESALLGKKVCIIFPNHAIARSVFDSYLKDYLGSFWEDVFAYNSSNIAFWTGGNILLTTAQNCRSKTVGKTLDIVIMDEFAFFEDYTLLYCMLLPTVREKIIGASSLGVNTLNRRKENNMYKEKTKEEVDNYLVRLGIFKEENENRNESREDNIWRIG